MMLAMAQESCCNAVCMFIYPSHKEFELFLRAGMAFEAKGSLCWP